MGLFDGAADGTPVVHRRHRPRARRPRRAGGGRRLPVVVGGGGGPRLRHPRPDGPHRGRGAQPGRRPTATRCCCGRRWRRSASRCWARCGGTTAWCGGTATWAWCRWPSVRTRWRRRLAALAAAVADRVDLAAVVALARSAPPLDRGPGRPARSRRRRPVRVAVAGGRAFTFTYTDTLDALAAAGAEVVRFDPLRDERAARTASTACSSAAASPRPTPPSWPPTGPCSTTSAAGSTAGLPTWAECGGLAWLCRDLDGHPMAGVIAATATMTDRLHLGYRTARTTVASPLGPAGTELRGHEFHYSTVDPPGDALAPAQPLRRPRRRPRHPVPRGAPTSTTTRAATRPIVGQLRGRLRPVRERVSGVTRLFDAAVANVGPLAHRGHGRRHRPPRPPDQAPGRPRPAGAARHPPGRHRRRAARRPCRCRPRWRCSPATTGCWPRACRPGRRR